MNDQKKQGGCGGHCACADMAQKDAPMTCAPKGEIVLDKEGKCPCGKPASECCHKDKIADSQNDALSELCSPHNGKNVC